MSDPPLGVGEDRLHAGDGELSIAVDVFEWSSVVRVGRRVGAAATATDSDTGLLTRFSDRVPVSVRLVRYVVPQDSLDV